MTYDVAIVGGGPGGLYAAGRLARRGFEVVVLEEHRTAGDPVHCTGILAVEAFHEFAIPDEPVLNSLSAVTLFGPSGISIEYRTPSDEAVVIDRRLFDRLLCERAKASGAAIVLDAKVVDVRRDGEQVVLSGSGGVVRARACILACGASYRLQRQLDLGVPDLHLQSAQIELPARADGPVELHFGLDVAPRGFGWVVPVRRPTGSCARVGLMCDRSARRHFDRFLARIAPRWGIDSQGLSVSGAGPRVKLLPLGPIPKTYTDRVLAIGDAAGLVKATTGGGIYYSLLSATLAADVLAGALAAGDLSAEALSLYEWRWRALLGDELKAQMKLRRLASRLSDDDIDSLFELARTDGIMPIVRRTARFNRHRDLIVSLLGHPPARRILMRRVLGRRRAQAPSSA